MTETGGRPLSAAAIRRAFEEFFVARDHLTPPPASLVPAGDPSVLFTTAGMQQFKPYYLGVDTPPGPRLTTCQRCFRTSDIENVGHTARHNTFFEMLGNFSIGDYFKADAIAWAIEFSRELGVDFARVKVSVFGGDDQVPADDEAIALWKSHGFTDNDIVRLGRSDNFWGPAGPTGPCGPCSELYFDMGEELGCGRPDCGPGCECDRWLEYWNLVFVQYDMAEDGALSPLAKQSIDTGMGLERITAVHQVVATIYETDLFRPLDRAGRAALRHRLRLERAPSLVPCARWPSTPAASPSSSWTECCRATRGATTCCGASSAAPFSRACRSGSTSRSWRDSANVSSISWARPIPLWSPSRDDDRRARRPTRRQRFRRTLDQGHGHPRRGHAARARLGRRAAARGRLRAPRHLRVPVRPDPRDRAGQGHERRRGRIRAAHGRPARACPRRSARRRDGPGRGRRLPARHCGSGDDLRRLRAPRGLHDGAGAAHARRRAASRSSSRSRRSMPRAAVRSPTRAGSTPTRASSTCSTSCASRTIR